MSDEIKALQSQFIQCHAQYPRLRHATIDGIAVHQFQHVREYLRSAIASTDFPPSPVDDNAQQTLTPHGFYFGHDIAGLDTFNSLAGEVAEAVSDEQLDELGLPLLEGASASIYGAGHALLLLAYTLADPWRGVLVEGDSRGLVLPDGSAIRAAFIPPDFQKVSGATHPYLDLLADLRLGNIGEITISRAGVFQTAQRALSTLAGKLNQPPESELSQAEFCRLTSLSTTRVHQLSKQQPLTLALARTMKKDGRKTDREESDASVAAKLKAAENTRHRR